MENTQDLLRRLEKKTPGILEKVRKMNPNSPPFMNTEKEAEKVRTIVDDILPDTYIDEETAKKYLESLNISNCMIIDKNGINEVELSNLLVNFANEYGRY